MATPPSPTPRIALALSGGGVRAAVFHLGVLKRLAAEGKLENVTHLSTVSGGSLLAAAVICHTGGRWPTSNEFLTSTFPTLERILVESDLFSFRAIGLAGLLRCNIRLFHDRARILADLLSKKWGVNGHLRDLPDSPLWWINSTCIETGKNWRFSKREMGDWRFGRHYSPSYLIAEAAAASAAVPYAIGALRLGIPEKGWYRTDPATRKPLGSVAPTLKSVRLWDGGAYENLGLEALYKPGRLPDGWDVLVCSDASGPLGPPIRGRLWMLLRGQLVSPRLFDIVADQIRSLRSRMLFRDIEAGVVNATIVRMGTSVRDVDTAAGSSRPMPDYERFLSDADVGSAVEHPVDLCAVAHRKFQLIVRHGFEITDTTLTSHLNKYFCCNYSWSESEV